MEYNSARKHLIIPEYGRNVQRMVEDCKAITDREQRNLAAKAIIEIIGNLNPHLRDTPDYRHKLWDHLFIMSNFELEVDSPYPIPTKETFSSKPNRVPYPEKTISFRHYGNILKGLIQKLADMEEGDPKREALLKLVANQMKKSYLVWNKDTVEDEVIWREIKALSGGKILMREGDTLASAQALANSMPVLDSGRKAKRSRGKKQITKKKFRKNL